MKRIALLILALSCIMIHLTSCKSPNIIEVTSNDYPKLTKLSPSEFDEEKEIERELAALEDDEFVYRV